MRVLLSFLLFTAAGLAQTGNACSTNTSAATGTVQSYGLCNPLVINGRNAGGWIALNRTGDQSNSETQCYSPGNVFIQDGILTMQDRSLSKTCNYYPAQTGTGSETNAFSSSFVQWNNFNFTFGDILIRAKGPSNVANGGWPALWLLGSNCEFSSKVTADNTTFNGKTCNWPNSGSEEIDIVEQDPTAGDTQTTSHCNLFSGGGNVTSQYNISNSSQAFHTYELRWTSGNLQWFYDGTLQSGCTISSANVPSTPMFLQMNIAMTPTATATNLPTTMQVDWVKVCQPSPCNATGSNIIFYDDFVTQAAPAMLGPMARVARLAGLGSFTPGNSLTFVNQLKVVGKVTTQ